MASQKTLTKSGNEFQKVIIHTGTKFSACFFFFFLTESFPFFFFFFFFFLKEFISNISKCSPALRRGGLMVSVLDSGSSGPGSGNGRGRCVVFLGRTLYSHGASPHPGV